MPPIRFVKMHGLGNDFVVLDQREAALDLDPSLIRALADRRRGVGFDQLVVLRSDPEADALVLFVNADGTPAGACGNGTRCAARLVAGAQPRSLLLRTAAGMLRAVPVSHGLWQVDMGPPRLRWDEIPLAEPCETLAVPIGRADLPRPVAVGMGNPHAVFLVDDLDRVDVATLGPALEHDPIFPERANIGFLQVTAPERGRLRVWERGAGLTPACGSGACAAMVAGRRLGVLGPRATLELDGGALELAWDGVGGVQMTGPATLVYEGCLAAEILS